MKHLHIWKKIEVLRERTVYWSPKVYAYVCRCGETGHPVR